MYSAPNVLICLLQRSIFARHAVWQNVSQCAVRQYSLHFCPIQIREIEFPLRAQPLPQAVICSIWGSLASFPKRSSNPFPPVAPFRDVPTHSTLFFERKSFKKWSHSLDISPLHNSRKLHFLR